MSWNAKSDESYLTKVIAHVVETYKVEPTRVYLGGHSSGAGFTWYYGLKNQKTFAALVPAAGFWHDRLVSKKEEPTPEVYIYHSENDDVIPFSHAERAQATLKEKGFAVTLVKDTRKHGLGPKLQSLVKAVLAKTPKRAPASKQ